MQTGFMQSRPTGLPATNEAKDSVISLSRKTHPASGVWVGIALLMIPVITGPANAQDGRAIMEKVVAAYQKLTSYDGRGNSDGERHLKEFPTKPISRENASYTLQFKRPNRLMLDITTPATIPMG